MTLAQVQYSLTVLTLKLLNRPIKDVIKDSSVKLHVFSCTSSYSLQNFAYVLKPTVFTATRDT